MLLVIFGIRRIRIGYFLDTDHICYPCRNYEKEVSIYRSYFHICFIPVFPVRRNEIEIRCKNCGDETRTESLVKKYKYAVKTPFWMYSAILLAIIITAGWFYWHKTSQEKYREYVARPLVGDVYTIVEDDGRNTGDRYSFLRIAGFDGDSVLALHNNLDYGGFVSSLADDDYFVKSDTLSYSKKQLSEMLQRKDIYSIKRNMGDIGDFKRTR